MLQRGDGRACSMLPAHMTAVHSGSSARPDLEGTRSADALAGTERRQPPAWSRAGPALLLLLPVVIVSLCFFPGHMSNDSLTQIEQARDGEFTNHHAALLTALWSLVWPLGVRPGWILVLQVAVFVAGSYLVLRSFFGRWSAASLAAVIALSPPVFGMLGYFSRDTWFTALLLATFGLVLWSTRESGRRASVLLVLALASSWLTLASRQNAIPAVLLAVAAIVWRARRGRAAGRPLSRAVAITGASVALTAGMYGSQVAISELIGVKNVHPEQYVFIYDVAMLSDDVGRNLFPADVMPRRELEVIEQYFHIDSVNPLLFSPDPPILTPLERGQLRSLGRTWRRTLADHPFDYLEGRWKLWLRQVAIGTDSIFIYHPWIDPNDLGQRVKFDGLNAAARDYVEAFAERGTFDGGPLHTVWAYLLVNVAGAATFLRRRFRSDQRLVGFFALSAVTHQAGLFFGAMGTQYRFQFPVVALGAMVLLALVREAWRKRRDRSSRATRAVTDRGPAPPPPAATPTARTPGSP